MSENQISLLPSDTLSKPSDNQKRPNRFILFNDSWMNLQNYITTCLALPINQGDFGAKYGDFADLHQLQQVVAAMKKVQALTTVFGNPKTIKEQKDTNYLLKEEPPSEIYAHGAQAQASRGTASLGARAPKASWARSTDRAAE